MARATVARVSYRIFRKGGGGGGGGGGVAPSGTPHLPGNSQCFDS